MTIFRVHHIAAAAALIFLFAMPPALVHACGWWGDGEMDRHTTTTLTAPDGKPVPEILDSQTAKLPGRMGYGIAVPEPGRAIPYLQATYGRPLNRIGELKAFGFKAVIDIGTPAKTARLHRAETKAVGMLYFNIPVSGDTPSAEQTRLFSQIVAQSGNAPLLVYAPTAPLLGMMWAFHRLSRGAPPDFAISVGRSLGMTEEQEAVLRKRAEF